MPDEVVLDRFDEIREVLRSDSFVPDTFHPRTPLFDSTLLLMTGEDHRHRRRLEMQLFARSAIKVLNEQTLLPGIRMRLEQLFDGAATPLRVDLVPLLKTMMYRVAATVTGIDLLGDAESVNSFIELQERFARGGSVTYESADTDERLSDAHRAREEFREQFFDPSLERRNQLLNAGGPDALPQDVLSILLRDGAERDHEAMLFEAMLYFSASTGNTARMVPPCVDDLWTWLSEQPLEKRPDLDTAFFHRAAAETLRLHPSSPKIYRRASYDCTLSTGTFIPAGYLVRMDVIAANRDPDVYGPDPDIFDPYRTTSLDKRVWGMAFGDGPHKCIGEGLAAGTPAGAGTRSDGIIPSVVQVLFELDIQPDDELQPRRQEIDRIDLFDSFPVRLLPVKG